MVDLTVPIPARAVVKVKRGAVVEKGAVLAQVAGARLKKEFDLAKIFNVKPITVRQLLKVELGGRVAKGDLLAEKKTLLGKRFEFKAPLGGVLKSLSTDGKLVIEQEGKEKVIKSPLTGRVFEIKTTAIVLKIKGISLGALESFGVLGKGLVSGMMIILTRKGERLDFTKLSADLKGTIVAGSGPLSPAVLIKADTLGISGLVVDKMDKRMAASAKTPIMVLGKEFEKIREYGGRQVVMDLERKRLIVSETEKFRR